MAELGDRGILGEEAFRQIKLGISLLMTAVGIPMLWMGEEFGEYHYKTQDQSKIDWTLLSRDLNKNLYGYYKGLIALREHNHALYTGQIAFFHENPDSKVLAYIRWNGEGSRVVVVANFSDQFLGGYSVPDFPEDGIWHEWTGNYDVQVGDRHLMTDLGPHKAKVFVWQ